jgi:hypothetical protein
VVRFNVNTPIGNAFQYSVVIDELEVLGAQQQVRTVRENSLNFTGLTAGNFKMAQLPGVPGAGAAGMPNVVPTEGTDVATKAIDLFNSIKNSSKKKP